MPECEFHDVLTAERCHDFRCKPYRLHLDDGQVVQRGAGRRYAAGVTRGGTGRHLGPDVAVTG